ncbi:flagellar protein FlgN [Gorillibacterium massiliense]|uniref:flagellar protein FlgN n=1 Tax=Gorillibacterium massiliense TaxID=1280390 RepID=UPI0005933256|nr:flagellar protein FlgN [Gorillibacterium massiliense]
MTTQALVTCLEELIGLHESLWQLARDKTDVLVRNQVDELNRLVNKETQSIRKIAEWESKRKEAVADFLKQKGFRPDPAITMTELSKLVSDREEKRRLQELQGALQDIAARIQATNERNKRLIEHSLEFVELSLDLLTAPEADEMVYQDPRSSQQSGKRVVRFDTKA